MSTIDPILDVRDLNVALQIGERFVPVVSDVNLAIAPGERVGMAGESGCGKSLTALAIMGLLPRHRARVRGQVLLDGRDLLPLRDRQLSRIRGREISIIFQEPMTALDPVFTIGEQIAETIRSHFVVSRAVAKARAIEELDRVGIAEPARRYGSYVHQLSGGMRQRAMIAMALACKPKLLIADEPTTALDVTIQAQIMELITELSRTSGTALLMITHDLGLLSETCERMLTMYAGQVVEQGEAAAVLRDPRHPYTRGLRASLPGLNKPRSRLSTIPGHVPTPDNFSMGCRFRARCEYALAPCEAEQELFPVGAGREVRCIRHTLFQQSERSRVH